MCTNARTSDEVLTKWLTNDKKFDITHYKEEYQIEEISIVSTFDKHTIPASYIYAKNNKDKNANTVIMVHGLLGNRLSNYPMSQLFLKNGYNVITYDQRSSGKNTALHTTFGYWESNDTADYINYAAKQAPSKKIGLWGQSMGAATVENAMDSSAFKKYGSFVVLDSPMGDMQDMIAGHSLTDRIKVFFADIINRIQLGYSFTDQKVISQVQAVNVPSLMVNSKADHSIPFELQMKVYDALTSPNKSIFTVEDSEHSDIYFDHPDEYQDRIDEFLKKIK